MSKTYNIQRFLLILRIFLATKCNFSESFLSLISQLFTWTSVEFYFTLKYNSLSGRYCSILVVYLVDIVTDWVTPPVQCFAVCEARHKGQPLQKHPTLRLLLPAVRRVDTFSPGLALSALLGYYLIFFISKSYKGHSKASFNKHVSYNSST